MPPGRVTAEVCARRRTHESVPRRWPRACRVLAAGITFPASRALENEAWTEAETKMKFAMVGAVLITLPAIAALIYGLISGNHLLLWAALASFSLNTLPFIVAG